jgi:integrase/recombinase XerC
MRLPPYLEQYLSYIASVRGMSERTLIAYREDLAAYIIYCDNYELDFLQADSQEIRLFISELAARDIASVSVNRALSSIRGFYRWLVRTGVRGDNPASALKNLKTARTLPVFLWETEMADFAGLPELSGILWPERDKAIILSMYSAGLRISEAASLAVGGIERDFSGGWVVGKGDKERQVFFSGEAREALIAWLPYRNSTVKAVKPTDKVFISRKGAPLSVSGIRYIIGRYAECSGLARNVHPHALRHTFATHLVNSGCDVRVVQELLGHASLSTTQRYTHVDIEGLKQVYSKAHPHSGNAARKKIQMGERGYE